MQSNLFKSLLGVVYRTLARSLTPYSYLQHSPVVCSHQKNKPGKMGDRSGEITQSGILIIAIFNNRQAKLKPPVIAVTKNSNLMLECCDENWIGYLELNWEICLHSTYKGLLDCNRSLPTDKTGKRRLEIEKKIIFFMTQKWTLCWGHVTVFIVISCIFLYTM